MRKTFIRFFSIADYEEEEIWLREQSRRGLKLKKVIPPYIYVFEEAAPEDVIYRLDYANKNPDEDYLQMFRDYGWEYCGQMVGWLYFRKPVSQVQAETDGEIFSDDESRLAQIRRVIRTRLIPLLLIFIAVIIPNLVTNIAMTGGFFTAMTVIFSLLALLYVYLIVHCGCKLKKLQQKYEGK